MLSDIAGDAKRCVDSRENYLNGRSTRDYSEFWLNRVETEIQKESDSVIFPELLRETDNLRRYLRGEIGKESVLLYWKQFEIL